MATIRLHKELAPLGKEARNARWTINSTSSGQVVWRNPTGDEIVQHTSNLHEGSGLLPKLKGKIRKELDAQYGRDQILAEAADRAKAERLADELAQQVAVPRLAEVAGERPMPPKFQQAEVETAVEAEVQEEPVVEQPVVKQVVKASPKKVAKSAPKVQVKPKLDYSDVIRQGDPGPKFPFRLAMLPVSALRIADITSGGYQRPADPTWAVKLAIEFDWDNFGRIEVSERDGDHYVMDGQHRLIALDLTDRIPAEEKLEVPALIYTGMTLADEADRYLRMNTVRKNTYSLHAWAARLVSDPKAQEINRIVTEAGFVVSQSASPGRGFVSATGRLEMIYDEFGATGLAETLMVLRDAYGTADAISAVLLGATSLVLNIYDGVDRKRLAAVLASTPAAGWNARAKFYTTNRGMADASQGFKPSTQPVALAQMLVLAYNQGLKKIENTLGSFDGAYAQYISAKRLSPRNQYVAEKRKLFNTDKPSPGSWLRQPKEV